MAEFFPQLSSHLRSPSYSYSSPASISSEARAEPSAYQPASSPSLSSASGEQSPIFRPSIRVPWTLPADFSIPNGSNTYCHSTASSDSGIDSPSHQSSTPSSEASGISSVIGKDATYSCNGITISLLEADMWSAFNTVGNEMIVTKPGRRLFPSLLVGLHGLDHHTTYDIYLKATPVDEYRYKFLDMQWVALGESEVRQYDKRQIYKHPNSPKSGSFWMKKPISFKPCKITHNPLSKHGNILLHTMHKYVLTIVVTPVNTPSNSTAIFLTSTEFIAVSSYQNTALTQLKIDNNPFAKGFRDRDILPAATQPVFSPAYTKELPWENGLQPPLPDISKTIETSTKPHIYRPPLPLYPPPFSTPPALPSTSDKQQLPPVDYIRPL